MEEMVLTAEEIAKQYSSAMDSVNLVAELKAKATLTVEEADCLARNVEHLGIMLAKTFWTTENLTPFQV
jgi:hypothetical protein